MYRLGEINNALKDGKRVDVLIVGVGWRRITEVREKSRALQVRPAGWDHFLTGAWSSVKIDGAECGARQTVEAEAVS